MPSLRPRTSVFTFSAWGIFFALVACPIAVPAADRAALGQGADTEKTFSVQVGAQSSDNIGRDQAEESGIASLAGITANIAGERSAISWSLNGNLQYFDYGQQEYDNEVVGAGVAVVEPDAGLDEDED